MGIRCSCPSCSTGKWKTATKYQVKQKPIPKIVREDNGLVIDVPALDVDTNEEGENDVGKKAGVHKDVEFQCWHLHTRILVPVE